MHHRYTEFTPLLISTLSKVFVSFKFNDPEANSKFIKKRITMRLLIELYIVAVFSDSSVLVNMVQDLVNGGLAEQKAVHAQESLQYLSLIVNFVKYGSELLGLPPKDDSLV